MIKLCVGLLYSIQLYLANGFHVAVRLFSDSSQMNAVSLHAVACQPRFMFHVGVDILSENKPLLSFPHPLHKTYSDAIRYSHISKSSVIYY